MKLSEENKRSLLLHLHQTIDDYARQTASHINNRRINNLLSYPPNVTLSEEEQAALNAIAGNDGLISALAKVMAGNTAEVFFDFFNILDGTGDPVIASADWSGVLLVDYPDNDPETEEMLHDDFFSTYWEWLEERDRR